MRSLRGQLTLATASVGIAVMAIFIIVLTVIVGPLVNAPIARSLSDAGEDARRIVAAAPPTESLDVLIATISEREQSKGVQVVLFPRGQPLPPALHAGPKFPYLPNLFGLRTEVVPVRHSTIMLVTDPQRMDAAVAVYLATIAVAIIASLAVSVLFGRWNSERAVSPLLSVTRELRRFASGDFSQRQIRADDHGEIGDLTLAFNEAAAQVAASFEERRRVEQQMRRFIADAGHELRTPLTIVGGFVDVLNRGVIEDPVLREEAFAQLSSQIRRMQALIDRLLKLSSIDRLPTTKPEIVDVCAIVHDAVKAIRAARAVDVACEADGEALVLADPADVYEAVMNLLDNAGKYGDGTPVSVSVEHDDRQVVVRVRDRGPGITEADVDRLFERFYRGESQPAIAGAGLGLSIAKAAAQRAGGTVRLEESRPGSTTFTVVLPRLQQAVAVAQYSSAVS